MTGWHGGQYPLDHSGPDGTGPAGDWSARIDGVDAAITLDAAEPGRAAPWLPYRWTVLTPRVDPYPSGAEATLTLAMVAAAHWARLYAQRLPAGSPAQRELVRVAGRITVAHAAAAWLAGDGIVPYRDRLRGGSGWDPDTALQLLGYRP